MLTVVSPAPAKLPAVTETAAAKIDVRRRDATNCSSTRTA